MPRPGNCQWQWPKNMGGVKIMLPESHQMHTATAIENEPLHPKFRKFEIKETPVEECPSFQK